MSTETQEKTTKTNDVENSTCELGTYNGSPMFIINKERRYPFSFGIFKAKLIVKHFDKLKKFVESEGKSL